MPTSPADTFGSMATSSRVAPSTPATPSRSASYSPIQWSYHARPPSSVHSRAKRSIRSRPEAVAALARDAPLDGQDTRLVRVRMERPRERARDDARRLDRGLHVHAEVDDVADRLHHRLALRVLPRAAEGHQRAAIAHEER